MIIFLPTKDFQKNPFVHRQRGFRAELPAAEAANAAMVVEFQLPADYGNNPGRARLYADTTKDAPALNLHRPGRQVVSEPVLEKTGQTELYIRERRKLERLQLQTL